MTFNELRTEHESLLKTCRNRQRYTVDITDTGRDGDSIARIGSLVIFVNNARAGDKNMKIKVTVTKVVRSDLISYN